ncbi:alpha/beta fold hydrolase [Nocardia sp. NPDC004068]|uniref:alpha/beta fold hydrolase n=1 Tax=Nocardia sp. NPDC004068 TaxID=3364303 RepID=UPI00369724AE
MTATQPSSSSFTVRHDGVTIPVFRGGHGWRPLVLCPGLLSTRAEYEELIELLREDFDVLSFDLRGHGASSAGDRYSFEAFLGDFAAVMADSGLVGAASPPVLVGHSLGADLIVHYAAEHPRAAAEIVVIDGADPVPEPFLTDSTLPEFRALIENLTREPEFGRRVALTARDILDLDVEIDAVRSRILDRYRRIEVPITMIMSTSMAGNGTDERTTRWNANWRTGVERLVRELPHIRTHWVDAGHALVTTHAESVARIIRSRR